MPPPRKSTASAAGAPTEVDATLPDSVTPDQRPARYLAWLFSTGTQQQFLEGLFGVENEIAASLRPGLDHHVAHARLQWWREECERSANGNPLHPLTRKMVASIVSQETISGRTHSSAGSFESEDGGTGVAMSDAPADVLAGSSVGRMGVASHRALPQLADLRGFVDTTVWDLAGATFDTRRELAAYCERWSAAMVGPIVMQSNVARAGGVTRSSPGAVLRPAAAAGPNAAVGLAAAPNPTQPPAVLLSGRSLGACLRELEMLNDVAREARFGRLRVPLDEIERVGADPADLAKPPWPAALADLLRERHRALRAEIASAVGVLNRSDQLALRGLLVWVALVLRFSVRAQNSLPDSYRPRRFDAVADTWFAWRAARKATSGRFRT